MRALVTLTGPSRFTPKHARKSVGWVLATSTPGPMMPALLIKTSRPSPASSSVVAAPSTDSSEVTSSCTNRTCPGVSASAAAAAPPRCSLRAPSQTVHPSSASSDAVWKPSPLFAPVMSAVVMGSSSWLVMLAYRARPGWDRWYQTVDADDAPCLGGGSQGTGFDPVGGSGSTAAPRCGSARRTSSPGSRTAPRGGGPPRWDLGRLGTHEANSRLASAVAIAIALRRIGRLVAVPLRRLWRRERRAPRSRRGRRGCHQRRTPGAPGRPGVPRR